MAAVECKKTWKNRTWIELSGCLSIGNSLCIEPFFISLSRYFILDGSRSSIESGLSTRVPFWVVICDSRSFLASLLDPFFVMFRHKINALIQGRIPNITKTERIAFRCLFIAKTIWAQNMRCLYVANWFSDSPVFLALTVRFKSSSHAAPKAVTRRMLKDRVHILPSVKQPFLWIHYSAQWSRCQLEVA